jgi:hypothetical protein
MSEERLTFKAHEYRCDPCSLRQGTAVRELVRMIPKSVVMFGKLVGDEYYCCPICFEPKFEVKGRKAVNRGKTKVAKDTGPGSAGQRRAASTGPVLVKG